MNSLPVFSPALLETSLFLNQTAKLAFLLVSKSSRCRVTTEEELELLLRMEEQPALLQESLQGLERRIARGAFDWWQVVQSVRYSRQGQPTDALNEGMIKLDGEMVSYPGISHPGLQGNQILPRAKKKEVTVQEAEGVVRAFLDIPAGVSRKVEHMEDADGAVPAYVFRAVPDDFDLGVYTVYIAWEGGDVV